ncbi:MAG: PilW family protein [Burkholderiales bacterium]
MRATQLPRRGRAAGAGFSLMELMVGLAIGMIAMVTIVQVMSFFEAQRRTTSGSADAQTNGGIALYAISRDLQMAGYPLMTTTDSPLECTTITSNVAGITSIGPVALANGTAGASPASDSITIRYGTTLSGGAPTQISSLVGSAASVGSNLGCQLGDITLIMSGVSCAISRVPPTPTTNISAPTANPNTVTLENTALAAAGANLSCLGTWNEITYAVNAGNLERTAVVNGVSTTTPIVAGIVNLQAQYGISAAANTSQVTAWVNAETVGGVDWAAPSVSNRNRIKAVRIAVVARNARLEPEVVSAACTSTTAAAPGGVCAWEGSVASPAPVVDLSTGNANWNRYRYRVFETIIPLRNVIWSKDTL